MSIFGALGLGLLIVILQAAVPRIFSEIEATAVALLQGAQVSIDVATEIAAAAAILAR